MSLEAVLCAESAVLEPLELLFVGFLGFVVAMKTPYF
jgi:hypothetical protein